MKSIVSQQANHRTRQSQMLAARAVGRVWLSNPYRLAATESGLGIEPGFAVGLSDSNEREPNRIFAVDLGRSDSGLDKMTN